MNKRSEESGERRRDRETGPGESIPSHAGNANTGGKGVSSHPGAIDRMAGGKVSKETGPSHPAYLPRGKSRR